MCGRSRLILPWAASSCAAAGANYPLQRHRQLRNLGLLALFARQSDEPAVLTPLAERACPLAMLCSPAQVSHIR